MKLSVMRAINSALKPGGRHCFYVITTPEHLTDADRQMIERRDGNDFVESDVPYVKLLRTAGFVDVEMVDVTPGFLETLRAWKQAWLEDSDVLAELLGEEDFERRLINRTYDIENTEAGLNPRYRCFGVKP